MIIRDHNITTDTPADNVPCAIFHDKYDLESLFFLVVTTVACDSGGQGTCAGSKVHDLGTIEDDYFLVFVGW